MADNYYLLGVRSIGYVPQDILLCIIFDIIVITFYNYTGQ